MEVLKKKVFRRDIRDFQNAVTFLFEEIEQKFCILYLPVINGMILH